MRLKKILNKLESDKFIINSSMNYTPFEIIYNYDQALDYLNHLKENQYPVSIRFKGRGIQPFKPNLNYYHAFNFCYSHFEYNEDGVIMENPTPLGIYEATEEYDKYRISNCELQINSDLTIDAHWCPGSIKMRDALGSIGARHAVKASLNYRLIR